MQALLKETWTEYWYNFKTGLAFLLLLVFVVPFLYLHGFYFSSGSVFGDYDFAKLTPGEFLISAAVLLAYLFAYAVFLTLTIFAVRKRYSAVKVHYFLSEQIHKFALKVFGFLVAVLAVAWFLGWLWLSLGLPMAWLQLLWLIVLSALMFVPQAIVIDEQDVYTSVQMAWHFCLRHKRAWALAWLTGFVLLAVLVGLEFLVDYHFYVGKYAALVASLVFVVPFYEAMKSVLYMQKFDMVRRAYRHHSTKKHGRASSS